MEAKKVFKIPLIIWVCIFLISFFYGGIYTEIYIEGLPFTLENILLAILGAVMAGFFFFLLTLIVSYIYYKTKEK